MLECCTLGQKYGFPTQNEFVSQQDLNLGSGQGLIWAFSPWLFYVIDFIVFKGEHELISQVCHRFKGRHNDKRKDLPSKSQKNSMFLREITLFALVLINNTKPCWACILMESVQGLIFSNAGTRSIRKY